MVKENLSNKSIIYSLNQSITTFTLVEWSRVLTSHSHRAYSPTLQQRQVTVSCDLEVIYHLYQVICWPLGNHLVSVSPPQLNHSLSHDRCGQTAPWQLDISLERPR